MIPLTECVKRRTYRLKSRNLAFGVFDGETGFLGIREKFGHRYVFTEYHWDTGAPHGTVEPLEDLCVELPETVLLAEHMPGSWDAVTNRPILFDAPVYQGGRGWYFTDTDETCDQNAVRPHIIDNQKLFAFLVEIEERFDPELQEPTKGDAEKTDVAV